MHYAVIEKEALAFFTSDLLIFDKPGPPNKVQFPPELYKALTVSTVVIFNKTSLRWGQFQKSP